MEMDSLRDLRSCVTSDRMSRISEGGKSGVEEEDIVAYWNRWLGMAVLVGTLCVVVGVKAVSVLAI